MFWSETEELDLEETTQLSILTGLDHLRATYSLTKVQQNVSDPNESKYVDRQVSPIIWPQHAHACRQASS